MKRTVQAAGAIVLILLAALPATAATRHRQNKATGPVPQSADIAALNRASLAKIKATAPKSAESTKKS